MTLADTMKPCTSCKELKPLSDFAWRHKAKGTRQGRCRKCMSLKMRSSRYELKRKYGLTAEEYEQLLVAQGGVCFLCKDPETLTHGDKVIKLAVDHDRSCCPDHRKTCGKCIRKLLCADCNRLIGRLEADPQKTMRILQYLNLGF